VLFALLAMLLIPAALVIGTVGLAVGVSGAPVCAACSYPTVGLASGVCPECGAGLAGDGTRPAGQGRMQWRPSRPLAAACGGTLAIGSILVVWFILSLVAPRTWCDEMAFTARHAEGRWRAEVVAVGLREWEPPQEQWRGGWYEDPIIPRSSVRMRVFAPGGRLLTVRLVDSRRRAQGRLHDGTRVRTVDGISPADLRSWAERIEDPRLRQSIVDSAPQLYAALCAGSSGTPIRPDGAMPDFEVFGPGHSRWWRPQLAVAAPIGLAWLGVAGLVVCTLRRRGWGPIVLW
jgi:hypothetical protein